MLNFFSLEGLLATFVWLCSITTITQLFIRCNAAGNVLLLRNNLNLSPDIAEVSQEKLLSLVAERLIDSNSNVNVRVAFVISGYSYSCDVSLFDNFYYCLVEQRCRLC